MQTIEFEYRRSHVEEQLHAIGFTDTANMTYKQLVHKLSVLRAMEVDVEATANKFF